MINSDHGSVGVFGGCRNECQKGEPIELSDGRFMQANRCPLGNICIVVSDEPIADTTEYPKQDPLPSATIYTLAELEEVGYGNPKLGINRALSGVAHDPEAFVLDAPKPLAAAAEFYEQYIDKFL